MQKRISADVADKKDWKLSFYVFALILKNEIFRATCESEIVHKSRSFLSAEEKHLLCPGYDAGLRVFLRPVSRQLFFHIIIFIYLLMKS